MNKVVYWNATKTLFSFGGYGSGGQILRAKLVEEGGKLRVEGEWSEYEKNHLALQGMGELDFEAAELVHYPSLFFS
jgi:hypothetical protein